MKLLVGYHDLRMNVDGDQFAQYLANFHSTLSDTAKQYLPGHAASIFHLSFLPARIHGFVSTQFGVAWEYSRATTTTIDVEVGGSRIETLFLKQPGHLVKRYRDAPPFFKLSEGARVELHRCKVTNHPRPFSLEGPTSHLTLVNSQLESQGWHREVFGAEIFGNREASNWSPERAVGRAKDEVLAALAELNKADAHSISIQEYIATRKQKSVLLLGDYSPSGTERLNTIAKCVADLDLEPFLVKDVPDILGADLQQKVTVLGGLSRFVLIDDSSPSGHLVEVQIAQQQRWITVLLHSAGKRGSWMTAGLSSTSNVIHEQDFDPTTPCPAIELAVAWAQSKIGNLEAQYQKTYPWRFERDRS